ncbi:MAG: hypothetical protein HY708_02945 [Ignavibacteriae bacterium]|nr:hypothetical protein [Ignavibacteriota bacterium]
MITALYLLALQGLIGAFDTLYYHEWKAKLPALGRRAAKELRLHAVRDLLYAILFVGLALFEWRGSWAIVLAAVLALEIVFTLWDFVVEVVVRKPLGDVYAGERVTHAVMGILYGAMLVFLLSTLGDWWMTTTALTESTVSPALKWFLLLMGVGVFLSGVRDTLASLELPGSSWPWRGST